MALLYFQCAGSDTKPARFISQSIKISDGKLEGTVTVIAMQPAPSEERKQPAFFIYESDALTGLESGTAAFGEAAAAKGKRITEIQDIDPNSIQAIHMLKDKQAIAAFGEAGINGVVLISLKENAFKGKAAENAEEFIVYSVPADRFVKMRFYLDKKQLVKADAIDFNGVKVKSFTNQVLEKDWHEYEWDASESPAGTYIIV